MSICKEFKRIMAKQIFPDKHTHYKRGGYHMNFMR